MTKRVKAAYTPKTPFAPRRERRATWRIMRAAQPVGTHADRTWAWRQLWPMMSHDYRMARAVEIDRALRAEAAVATKARKAAVATIQAAATIVSPETQQALNEILGIDPAHTEPRQL